MSSGGDGTEGVQGRAHGVLSTGKAVLWSRVSGAVSRPVWGTTEQAGAGEEPEGPLKEAKVLDGWGVGELKQRVWLSGGLCSLEAE